MRTSDFDFELPPELVAQAPTPRRRDSRLLVCHRASHQISHHHFADLGRFLNGGDLLVANNSRVIPARLRGRKELGGGGVELLLIEEIKSNDWWVMLRPGKRVRPGTRIILSRSPPVTATIHEKNAEGHCRVSFSGIDQIRTLLQQIGEVPLPPYISRAAGGSGIEDRERYQTVFAAEDGSVAAPTAGLHFDEAFVSTLASAGVGLRFVTLHVGLGTFAPVKTELIGDHKMHEERFCIPEETALAIAATRKAGGRVIAVGTTSLRVLESTATPEGRVPAAEGRTSIFIHPPHTFRAVDGLLTNFHLPKSTLLMLVSAFASPGRNDGREWILDAYAEAIRERYRFFSYGDAMLIH